MTPRSPTLKKRFGQHHLRSGQMCRPLLDFLAPTNQRVLEIGAGGGVLTAELSTLGAQVIACEVDLEWVFYLRRRLPGVACLAVDASTFDYSRLPGPTLVTGNLPFNIAGRLIEQLLPHAATVPRAAFMVQKEVAERLVAQPGAASYGALSVLLAAYAKASWLGTLSPGSFRPPPKVAAAFVGLTLAPSCLPAHDMPHFTKLVRQAFAQRRKTLRNTLAAAWGRPLAEEVLAAVGLETNRRAQELPIEGFVEIYRAWRQCTSRQGYVMTRR